MPSASELKKNRKEDKRSCGEAALSYRGTKQEGYQVCGGKPDKKARISPKKNERRKEDA